MNKCLFILLCLSLWTGQTLAGAPAGRSTSTGISFDRMAAPARFDIWLHESGGYDAADALDTLIYLDAQEADLEHWFVARFMGLWHAAETDSASFYAQFRGLDEPGAQAFARSVWERINLPNLRDHISAARDRADIILTKDRDHRLTLSFVRDA